MSVVNVESKYFLLLYCKCRNVEIMAVLVFRTSLTLNMDKKLCQ